MTTRKSDDDDDNQNNETSTEEEEISTEEEEETLTEGDKNNLSHGCTCRSKNDLLEFAMEVTENEHFVTYPDAHEVDVSKIVEKLVTDVVETEDSELLGILQNDFEHQTSSIFVHKDTSQYGCYGTRSISAVTVKGSGELCSHLLSAAI
ncbi:hypothetical protein V2J09_003367 [Rumex salicifolius]